MEFRTFDPDLPIAIIGMGVMGSKVAWACARTGIPTQVYDIFPGKLKKSVDTVLSWSEGQEREKLNDNLYIRENLDQALDSAQLAFENVPEDQELKQETLAKVGKILDPNAYMGSNTSALLSTPLAQASGRPERFFNMNWTDPRSDSLVELMGNPSTASETINFAKSWAVKVGMFPLHVKKEQMGYAFNRLWRVIKKEVLRQIAEGIVEPQEIDRAWMLAFNMPFGPCGLMDMIGIESVKKIETAYHLDSGDESDKPPVFLDKMIRNGKTGTQTGEGFYSYPNPEYENPDWLNFNRSKSHET